MRLTGAVCKATRPAEEETMNPNSWIQSPESRVQRIWRLGKGLKIPAGFLNWLELSHK